MKQNNVRAFVNLHIRSIIPIYKQYLLQEIFVRFYFLVEITAGKVSINFTDDKGFHILLLLSDHMLFAIADEMPNRCQAKFSDLLLFVSYFASHSKGIKFGVYFFDVRRVN